MLRKKVVASTFWRMAWRWVQLQKRYIKLVMEVGKGVDVAKCDTWHVEKSGGKGRGMFFWQPSSIGLQTI